MKYKNKKKQAFKLRQHQQFNKVASEIIELVIELIYLMGSLANMRMYDFIMINLSYVSAFLAETLTLL